MSSSSLDSPLPTIQALNSSLTKLAQTLDPLLQIPFSKLVKDLESGSSQQQQQRSEAKDNGKGKEIESSEGKGKGKQKEEDQEEVNELAGMLDSARLRVSVAYVLLDLIWMYLKTRGIDPATHPVLGELERVKSYFGKIKAAQLGDQSGDRQSVDKTAADRFIRAALGSQIKKSASAIQPSEGVHKRFDFEKDEEEDEDDDSEGEDPEQKSKGKGKGKAKAEAEVKVGEKRSREDQDETSSQKSKKKIGKNGRIVPDVFEGAVTGPASSSTNSLSNTPKGEKSGKKKKKRKSGGGGGK